MKKISVNLTQFFVKTILILFVFIRVSAPVLAEEAHDTSAVSESHEEHGEKKFNAGETIMDHITDSHEWHFFTINHADGSHWHASIPLPCILYSSATGFSFFCFNKLEEGEEHDGYKLNEHKKIERADGASFYDFSITKNVTQMLLCVSILLWLLIASANKYKTMGSTAPRGMQSFLEIIIIFIRDEVAVPMLGKKAGKYLPYLLTVFFFIWINNLFGLVPGSANVTGNIAVTMVLALCTFMILLFSSKKYYWKHIFVTPGVPLAVQPIMTLVEAMSVFVKPFALMIRLFANMTAGHLIVLSFLSMIFIFSEKSVFAGMGVSVFSIAFSIFIYFLELLVTALQAYIFTILSALFISEAAAEPHH